MDMPEEYMQLVRDYDPNNLNMMNAQHLIRLFIYTRNLAEALEKIAQIKHTPYTEFGRFKDIANLELDKFKEWK
jgi:hypothetical protein